MFGILTPPPPPMIWKNHDVLISTVLCFTLSQKLNEILCFECFFYCYCWCLLVVFSSQLGTFFLDTVNVCVDVYFSSYHQRRFVWEVTRGDVRLFFCEYWVESDFGKVNHSRRNICYMKKSSFFICWLVVNLTEKLVAFYMKLWINWCLESIEFDSSGFYEMFWTRFCCISNLTIDRQNMQEFQFSWNFL